MNIIDILNKYGVRYELFENQIVMQCPSCKKEDGNRSTVLSFTINQNTGRGDCGECNVTMSQEEWLEKLGIKSTDEIANKKLRPS